MPQTRPSRPWIFRIIDDKYVEGNENFRFKVWLALDAIGNPLADITIVDNDTAPGQNPLSDTSFFVREQYLDFLHREPDAPGLAFWVDNIDKCNDPAQRPPGLTQAQCVEVQRINTSAAFFLSIEFQETGYLIERSYKTAFGRERHRRINHWRESQRLRPHDSTL